jgi:hypothetical protein
MMRKRWYKKGGKWYATIPGKDYPRKPRVSEVFKDEEDEMDDCIVCGLKKRKRAEDEVDKTISATTNQALMDYYDTSHWNSGEAKNLFVLLVGESLSACLEK